MDAAARWVKLNAPADDYLAPEEPPALAGGLPMASTPAEAAWLAAFRADEGLTIAESVRPFGQRLSRKPIEPDGRITTAIGRLDPEEFKAAVREGQLDPEGNLSVKRAVEREKPVLNRKGRYTWLSVPVTLDEFRTTEEQWRQANGNARVMRSELAERRAATRSRAPSPTARRFRLQPGFDLPADTRVYDDWTGEWYEPYEDESDDDPELLDRDDFDYYDFYTYDEYDEFADRFACSLTSEEEDRAREIAYGLPEGSLTLSESSWQERFFPDEGDKAEAADEVEVREAEDEFAPPCPDADSPAERDGLCQNPHGCDQLAKERGTRCPACYKYRSAHRGEERPLRLLNRRRRRQAA